MNGTENLITWNDKQKQKNLQMLEGNKLSTPSKFLLSLKVTEQIDDRRSDSDLLFSFLYTSASDLPLDEIPFLIPSSSNYSSRVGANGNK